MDFNSRHKVLPSKPGPSAADAAIALVRRAAEANIANPWRRGAVIELDAQGDCLVAGDLHGNLVNFQRLVAIANLPRFPERHLVIQELVHEVDKIVSDLCLSYRLVEMAARLKVTFGDRVHIIMGNHEFAEMLDFGIAKNRRPLNEAFDAGLERAYGAAWPRLKEAYKEFWRSLPLAVRSRNGLFICHSAPSRHHLPEIDLEYLHNLEPGAGFDRQSPVYHLLWDRDYAEETATAFARKMQARWLILAHTPCKDGHGMPNSRTLVLDSKDAAGCYALLPLRGTLTARQLRGAVHRIYPEKGAAPTVAAHGAAASGAQPVKDHRRSLRTSVRLCSDVERPETATGKPAAQEHVPAVHHRLTPAKTGKKGKRRKAGK